MKVALYARTSAAGLDQDTVGEILANLTAYAARRGWELTLACVDQGPGTEGPRNGLRRLREAVRANAVQAVLVHTLSHLATSLRHLTNLGQLLADRGVALIALEDGLDTTELAEAIRWHDWLETSANLDRQLRAEAARLAHLRASGARWGRPTVLINPLELSSLWEGRRGRRPLTQRELATKLGVSRTTVRKHLQALRAAGQLDDQARARRLSTRGGHRPGGRPSTSINDSDLTAVWKQQLQTARRRGRQPSLTAVARTLHVSRSRVRARLQELGLLEAPQTLHQSGRGHESNQVQTRENTDEKRQ
jgi:DNA invertase Pin-like site-specific DNA recombinase